MHDSDPRARALVLWVATFAALLVVLQAASVIGFGVAQLFPPPLVIALALVADLISPDFWAQAATSAVEIVVGFGIGALAGLFAGLLIGGSGFWRRVFEPLMTYMFVLPFIVFYPILLLAFGAGPGSKVAMAALSAFFPVTLSTITAYYQVRLVFLQVAVIYRLSPWQQYTRVILPSMLGQVLTGLRLGFGAAVIGALLGETKQARAGLGFTAMNDYQRLQIAEMYAVIVFIFGVTAVLNWLFERAWPRWATAGKSWR